MMLDFHKPTNYNKGRKNEKGGKMKVAQYKVKYYKDGKYHTITYENKEEALKAGSSLARELNATREKPVIVNPGHNEVRIYIDPTVVKR